MNHSDVRHSARPHDLDGLHSPEQVDAESPLSPIIKALTPDVRHRTRAPRIDPLPMAALANGLNSSSIVYAICRLDSSGRFHDTDIIKAAAWRPGERLHVQLIHGVVAFAPSPDGSLSVARCRRIAIPAYARKVLELSLGGRALLAAAPESRVVIVYPMAAVDDMMSYFLHSRVDK